MLKDNSKPVANPLATLREDFDDWFVLFDPDLDTGFGLNSVGAFIWKRLDGQNTVQDIMAELRSSCASIPDEAESFVRDFIQHLVDRGLAGYGLQEGWARTDREGGEKKGQEQIEWSIPALTELGHRGLNNVAAFVQGYPNRMRDIISGGGCGCCSPGSTGEGGCSPGGHPGGGS